MLIQYVSSSWFSGCVCLWFDVVWWGGSGGGGGGGGVVVFQAEDGIRDLVRSRGLGDVYKRQVFRAGDCTSSFRIYDKSWCTTIFLYMGKMEHSKISL